MPFNYNIEKTKITPIAVAGHERMAAAMHRETRRCTFSRAILVVACCTRLARYRAIHDNGYYHHVVHPEQGFGGTSPIFQVTVCTPLVRWFPFFVEFVETSPRKGNLLSQTNCMFSLGLCLLNNTMQIPLTCLHDIHAGGGLSINFSIAFNKNEVKQIDRKHFFQTQAFLA